MRKFKKLFIILIICFCLVSAYALTVNFYIIGSQKDKVLSLEEAVEIGDFDCVLVLGCGVKPDGTPSHMLYERVKAGSEVFLKTEAEKLLLSGDRSGETYDEPGVMNQLAINNGVEEKDITLDIVGFSTYESIYNAKNSFSVKKVLIITQPYHLSRALYIAESLDLDAYGYEAWLPFYPKQILWSLREVLARNKDFLKCMVD